MSSQSPKRGKPKKRLQGVAPRKEERERTGIGIQRWFKKERKEPEAPKTGLGPRNKLTNE